MSRHFKHLVLDGAALSLAKVLVKQRTVNETVVPDLAPGRLFFPGIRVECGPQRRTADFTLMVVPVFPGKVGRVCRDAINRPVLADIGHDHRAALRTAEHILPHVEFCGCTVVKGGFSLNRQALTVPFTVDHRRHTHIAVPGFLFAQDRKTGFRAPLIHLVEPVKVPDAVNNSGKGVWNRLLDLADPLLCDVGRAEHDVKCLGQTDRLLVCEKARSNRDNGNGPDLGLPGAAFRNDQPHLALLQAALDGLGHGELGVIEGVPGMLLDILIDHQHFRRQGLFCGIKQGHKQLLDPLGNRNAEGVQIVSDRV